MITVACVFVRGHVPFTAEYVTRLAAMVKRWMPRPYQFVCLTDSPESVTNTVTRICVPRPVHKGWWSKIELFNPARGLTGRVLYLDLDTLIVGPLVDIIDYPATFALAPDGGTFQPKNGLKVVKGFNSSVMSWDTNSLMARRVWNTFTPDVPRRLWGDQDHIGEQIPHASAMPAEWFPRLSEIGSPPFPKRAKVILAKKPKNLEAAKRWPWFAEAWN
jgi:hypothetical protein